jgi:hypothetical protein
MSARQIQREQLRHWLPSQGVDPAPLAELNAECLGLLALRAGDSGDSAVLPGLLGELRDLWANLPNLALRRLAAAPFSLFDAGFASSPRWLESRATGFNDLSQRVEPVYFESAAARAITRRMHSFWRELLVAASAGADQRLHELLLGGVQRLAAESLAAQAT